MFTCLVSKSLVYSTTSMKLFIPYEGVIMDTQIDRFIPGSYPVLLTPTQQVRAASILGEWLEQPERKIAMHLKIGRAHV